MPVFQRKNVEAIVFTRDSFEDVVKFTNGKVTNLVNYRGPGIKSTCTLLAGSGPVSVTEHDYVVKKDNGEFFVCKPEVFSAYYYI